MTCSVRWLRIVCQAQDHLQLAEAKQIGRVESIRTNHHDGIARYDVKWDDGRANCFFEAYLKAVNGG